MPTPAPRASGGCPGAGPGPSSQPVGAGPGRKLQVGEVDRKGGTSRADELRQLVGHELPDVDLGLFGAAPDMRRQDHVGQTLKTGNEGIVVTGRLELWTHDKNGEPHKAPPHPTMAVDTVRYVGDTVAMVVANSHEEAKDAAEQIHVDYEVLPANVDLANALHPGASQVHAEAPGNLIYDWELGSKADVDAVLATDANATDD